MVTETRTKLSLGMQGERKQIRKLSYILDEFLKVLAHCVWQFSFKISTVCTEVEIQIGYCDWIFC